MNAAVSILSSSAYETAVFHGHISVKILIEPNLE